MAKSTKLNQAVNLRTQSASLFKNAHDGLTVAERLLKEHDADLAKQVRTLVRERDIVATHLSATIASKEQLAPFLPPVIT